MEARVPTGEARPLALAAIPSDAVLARTYSLPAIHVGPISLWAKVWESDTIAGLHGESSAVFVLLHQEGPEPTVRRLSLTAPVMRG